MLVRETRDGFEPITETTVYADDGGKINRATLRRAIEGGDTATAARFGAFIAQHEPVPEGKIATGEDRFEKRNGEVWIVQDYIDPEPATPYDMPLRRWQFKAMVSHLDIGAQIKAAIEAGFEGIEREKVMARYLDSDLYDRNDPLFDQLATAIGLSIEDLDAAWMAIAEHES